MNEVVIVSAVRTAVGKAPRGTLRNTRPDDMAAVALTGALAKIPQLDKAEIEDVIMGCATPEAEQGMNVAKVAAFRAGLPNSVCGMTVNRYCSSGLQTIAIAADRIKGGGGDVILAGGTESMSYVPAGGNKISVNPWVVENNPGSYLSMGLTAENVARHYEISREEMDEFAYQSHRKSLAAQAAGRFDDEIVALDVVTAGPGKNGKVASVTSQFMQDEGPRADTSIEALAKLRPVFHAKGMVTAGNSSQTSDGAAAAVVMSRKRADELGIKPMARFVGFAYAGCDPMEMGIGPIYAIPKVLALTGLKLEDIGVIELNEAFASQSLAIIKMLGIDPTRVNPNGGAISLGHPMGCTGAKLTATILREMQRNNHRYGMVTMCVGGGMGAAGIFENMN